MGTREVQSLVDTVQEILQDTGGVHYAAQDVAEKINEGEIAVGVLRPDALSVDGDVSLVAGTRQSLPTGALRLRSLLYNRGLTGAEQDGEPIRLVEREALDGLGAWRSTIGTSVLEYIYDERDPMNFDVYPGLDQDNRLVRAVWEQAPAQYTYAAGALSPPNQTIGISDEYEPALIEWALYRLLSRQDDQTPGQVDGANRYTRFFEILGISVQSDDAASLKRRMQLK